MTSRSFFRRTAAAFLPAVSGSWGGESPKGNFVPLGSLEGSGTIRKVPELFVTFCAQKVRKESLVMPMQFHTGEQKACLTASFARMGASSQPRYASIFQIKRKT